MEYSQHKSKRNIPVIPENILNLMLLSGRMKDATKQAVIDVFMLRISQYEAAKRHDVNVGNVSRSVDLIIKKYEMFVDSNKSM